MLLQFLLGFLCGIRVYARAHGQLGESFEQVEDQVAQRRPILRQDVYRAAVT